MRVQDFFHQWQIPLFRGEGRISYYNKRDISFGVCPLMAPIRGISAGGETYILKLYLGILRGGHMPP